MKLQLFTSKRLFLFLSIILFSPLLFAVSFDIQNTHEFKGSINKENVQNLELKWEYATTPDNAPPVQTIAGPVPSEVVGAVSATPAVDGDHIYFNDVSGHITKLNRYTGELIWRKNYINDLSVPGFVVNASRNTPYVTDGLVIVGSNIFLLEQLCHVIGAPATPFLCHSGDGAIVLALDKNTGNVVWRKKVDTHPSTKVHGSISGIGNTLILSVAHWEEEYARTYPDLTQAPIDPTSRYQCCSARGSVVALNRNTGEMLWKTYLSSGDGTKIRVIGDEIDDPANAQIISLSPALQAVLNEPNGFLSDGKPKPTGFYGTSPYGHNPTIDSKRNLVYISNSENTVAPKAAEMCEKARRATDDPLAEIPLPAGLTCANLNQKLANYGNAMLALDINTGEVAWSLITRKYDAWNHACASADFAGFAREVPAVFSLPLINNVNCFYDPMSSDLGFGHHPILVKGVKMAPEFGGGSKDLVVAGNKDGRLFAVDADTGTLVYELDTEPGGIYGGLQFGIASEGNKVYFGTVNSRNTNRDINQDYHSNKEFLDINGFTVLGVRATLYIKKDGAPIMFPPAPGSESLPFPGPAILYGPLATGYPTIFPDPDGIDPGGLLPGFLKGPSSGPAANGPGDSYWTVINPPSDVLVDGLNNFIENGEMKTIAGMVQAVDLGTAEILWQRPATDGLDGQLGIATAQGTLAVGNGVIFIGYGDAKGTFVALDADTGEKLFQFNHKDSNGDKIGNLVAAPFVANDWIYFGVGDNSPLLFTNKFGKRIFGGNRVYGFQLGK